MYRGKYLFKLVTDVGIKHLNRLNGAPTLSCVSRRFFSEIFNNQAKPTLLATKSGTFQVYCIDENGVKTHLELSKSFLYQNLGLTIRDVRFQHPNMLFVRNKKIILRFEHLKVLICPDAILLIDPPFDDEMDEKDSTAEFWRTLPSLLTGSALYTSNLPFEYRALEAIFMHVLFEFSSLLAKLEPEINKLLSLLTNPSNQEIDRSSVHILLKNSARLRQFSTQLNEFYEVLHEILEDEDCLRSFCISSDIEGKVRSQLDAYVFSPNTDNEDKSDDDATFQLQFPRTMHCKHKINMQDEMENLIDSYLRDVEEIINIAKELKQAIENSSTAILINLDSHRNLLLRFELELTIGMFSCTVFGLIGMAFGMNLDSFLDENPYAFWITTFIMFVGSGTLWRWLLISSRKSLAMNSSILKTVLSDNNSSKPPPPSADETGGSSKVNHNSKQEWMLNYKNSLDNRFSQVLEMNEHMVQSKKSIRDHTPSKKDSKELAKLLSRRRHRHRPSLKLPLHSPFHSVRMKPLGDCNPESISNLFNQNETKRHFSIAATFIS